MNHKEVQIDTHAVLQVSKQESTFVAHSVSAVRLI